MVTSGKYYRKRRGTALIVALWITGMLSLLVGSFAFQAHLEARITSYYRRRFQAETLAKAGVERAHVLLVNSRAVKQHLGSDPSAAEMEKSFWEETRQLARGGGTRITESLGPGVIRLAIMPEPARMNINRLNENDWARILELCRVPEHLWDSLIDAFMDWIKPLEDPRLDGAGPDYYLGLDPPYRPRGADIASLDELLLVKGFTQEIVYGGVHEEARPDDPPMTGMADLFTTFGDGKINVNVAPLRVLMTLPGVDETTAQDILYEREGAFLEEWQRADAAFRVPADFHRRFPGLAEDLKERIMTDGRDYRIVSAGEVDGVTRAVRLTARFERNRFTYLSWEEADRM